MVHAQTVGGLLLLILFVEVSPARGQAPELLSIHGSWAPEVDVTNESNVVPDQGTAQVAHLDIAGLLPIPIVQTQTALLIGASYGLLAIRQGERLVGGVRWRELHETDLSVGLSHAFSEQWDALFRASAGLAGDFVAVDDKHFRGGLVALLRYRFTPEFRLGAAFLLNWQFGELASFPALSIDWKPDPQLHLSGLVPSSAQLVWRPNERFEIGLSASIRGNAYALRSDEFRRGFPCEGDAADNPDTPVDERVARPASCISQLAYSRGEVGPMVAFRVAGPIWISARANFLFLRRYQLVNDDGETPDAGDLSLPESITGEVGLLFRVPESKKEQ